MKYRSITGTNLKPSVICMGGLPFGVNLDEATSFSLLDLYFTSGGNFIDTALVYGEWLPGGKGLSEKTVGNWVKARRNRHHLIIGTKGAHPRLTSMDIQRLSREEIVSDLDESLQNLKTDYIDLYWLHRDDPGSPVEEILTTLNELVKTGKIRYFGCSNWRLERLQEAQSFAYQATIRPFVGNQLMWSLATPNAGAFFDPTMVGMDERLKAFHHSTNLAAMAYTSQARGFFSRLESSLPQELPDALKYTYLNEGNLAKMDRLRQLASEKDLPVSVLALSYLISQPFPTYPITAFSSLSQLQEVLPAGDISLAGQELSFLENGE